MPITNKQILIITMLVLMADRCKGDPCATLNMVRSWSKGITPTMSTGMRGPRYTAPHPGGRVKVVVLVNNVGFVSGTTVRFL